ncbi:MAG: hypothetical protein GF329_12590 [Candidatus Lokiarchaeota archaeon]|nr:hypothetical protein [Candidatus Lokiarchaeota archaeon]
MKTFFKINPIGIVKSKIKNVSLKASKKDINFDEEISAKADPRSLRSKIIVNKEYEECLDGIEDFSHIVILFWTQKNSKESRLIKRVHPGGIKRYPKKGIFATRSPARPNPICETTVGSGELNC